MITGFLTFVIWLLVMDKIINLYSKTPPLKQIHKAILVVTIVCFSGALIWLYNCHWDWLALGLFVLFFIYLAIQGLFGSL